jgi:hypothetical protein
MTDARRDRLLRKLLEAREAAGEGESITVELSRDELREVNAALHDAEDLEGYTKYRLIRELEEELAGCSNPTQMRLTLHELGIRALRNTESGLRGYVELWEAYLKLVRCKPGDVVSDPVRDRRSGQLLRGRPITREFGEVRELSVEIPADIAPEIIEGPVKDVEALEILADWYGRENAKAVRKTRLRGRRAIETERRRRVERGEEVLDLPDTRVTVPGATRIDRLSSPSEPGT